MPASLALALILVSADPAPDVVAKPTNLPTLHLSFDAAPADDSKLGVDVQSVGASSFTAGDVANVTKGAKKPTVNRGAASFDGAQSLMHIAKTDASAAAFTDGDVTWEGFFFWPNTNDIDVDPAIADRFFTQFRDDKATSTRLTMGLSRNKTKSPVRLAIAGVGSGARHLGKQEVSPDVWHHFALVVKVLPPTEATANRKETKEKSKEPLKPSVHAKAVWYLDYEKCGEVTFDGKSPATTLEALGLSPIAVGGRNLSGGKVDRGFAGLLDELRVTPRALNEKEFLRSTQTKPEQLVDVEFTYPVAEPIDWKALAAAKPTETLKQESLGVAGTPQPFSLGGFAEDRRGTWAVRTSREFAIPSGRYRLLVRTSTDAVLEVDGETLIDSRPPADNPLGALPTGLPRLRHRVHRRRREARLPPDERRSLRRERKEAIRGRHATESRRRRATPIVADDVIVGIASLDAKTGKTGTWHLLGSDGVRLDAYCVDRVARPHASVLEIARRRAPQGGRCASRRVLATSSRMGGGARRRSGTQPKAQPIDAFLATEDEIAQRRAGDDRRRCDVPSPRDARPRRPQSDGRRGPQRFSTTRAPIAARSSSIACSPRPIGPMRGSATGKTCSPRTRASSSRR